jgi:ribosomal protein S12 methylthiotransferase
MGCLSERYPNQLKEEIPEVDRFFGSNDHQLIASFLTGKEFSKDDPLFYRSLMTPSHYAYLKIAEGCDNGCTFCSIPLMRGKQKSRSISAIMNEAERLVNGGVKELLVIAQDTTSYGWDLQSKDYLDGLIRELNTLGDELDWIRVHYAHPAHLSQKIIDAMADSKKVCRYLDMPIQHASDDILQSMKRGLGQNGIKDRINRLRSAIPDIRLRTTLITGYPGETEKDYHELKNFIEEVEFDRLGIFTYSEEDDTLAANLDDNVPRQVKDDRRNELLDIQNEIALKKNEELVGKQLKVLVDESSESISVARTEYDSPEVDNIVRLDGSHKVGSFIDVIIDSVNEYELFASIIQ